MFEKANANVVYCWCDSYCCLFFFFQFNYQNVFYGYDLEKMASASGFTAIEQRKEVAEIFEGKLSQNTLLTMQEKIDQAKIWNGEHLVNNDMSNCCNYSISCFLRRICPSYR